MNTNGFPLRDNGYHYPQPGFSGQPQGYFQNPPQYLAQQFASQQYPAQGLAPPVYAPGAYQTQQYVAPQPPAAHFQPQRYSGYFRPGYPQSQTYPSQDYSWIQTHAAVQQGPYYQPLYHCPTCGSPVYVVYVPVPQAAESPKGISLLLVAVLVLLAVDIVFLRRR